MNITPIVVGYDGSLPAESAVRWALTEARHQGAPLHLVHAYEWGGATVPVPAALGWPDPTIRHEVAAIVEQAAAAAHRSRPEVPVRASVIDGPVVPTLRAVSDRAKMMVLGHRGLGGFAGLLAGSVALGVATHAHCPVVVVRGCAPAARPVLVGVDDSPEAEHAIGFAAEHAAARGVDLLVIRAWQPPPVPRRSATVGFPYDRAEFEAQQRRQATELVEPWQTKYPHVVMRVESRTGSAAHALVTASAEAQLVVVGSRGRGAFHGLLLGSVGRQLIQHSHCPVAVVRE